MGRSHEEPGKATRRHHALSAQCQDGAEQRLKFLVIWQIEISLLSREILKSVARMPDYAQPLEKQGKILARYHIPGSHGGAWIYDVASNEELDMLLARSPVYNYSRYQVYPLADMTPPGFVPPQ
jgi:muconolactone delta-isomerase